MPLFAIMGFDDPAIGTTLRDHHRTAHRSYVLTNDQPIRLAAALLDGQAQTGSLYIFEAEKAEDVWKWLGTEPFAQNGVYEQVVVRELGLAFSSLSTPGWITPPLP